MKSLCWLGNSTEMDLVFFLRGTVSRLDQRQTSKLKLMGPPPPCSLQAYRADQRRGCFA